MLCLDHDDYSKHYFLVSDGLLEVWAVAYPVAIVCILIYRPIASKVTVAIVERLLRK